jgi:hypothetical protein
MRCHRCGDDHPDRVLPVVDAPRLGAFCRRCLGVIAKRRRDGSGPSSRLRNQ